MQKRYSNLRRGLALTALLTGSALAGRAQNVGIGTTAPDASAALDIVSTSKGALLPRVASAAAITTPATGLIVFQTGGTPGYYYNAGTPAAPSWQQLATAAGAAVTASNGLTKTGQNIALGGTLTGATTIAQGGNNFSLTGGNFGLGTTTPTLNLDVVGSSIGLRNSAAWDHLYMLHDGVTGAIRAGGAENGLSLQVGTSASGTYGDASQNYRDVMRLLPGGNVGIGTATPGQKLEVAGGSIKIATSGQGLIFPDGSVQTIAGLSAVTASAPLGGSGTSASPLTISQASSSTNGFLSSADFNQIFGRLDNTDNNVSTLSNRVTNVENQVSNLQNQENNNYNQLNSSINAINNSVNTLNTRINNTDNNVAALNNSVNTLNNNVNTLTTRVGNVETSVATKFTLPALNSGSVLFSNGSTIAQSNASFFWDNANARLGIGTNAPLQKLEVEAGGIRAGGNAAFTAATAANRGAHLQWNRSGTEGETWLINHLGSGTANAGIRFGGITTSTGTAVTEWARFLNNGNFGLGTAAPTALLDVAGATRLRGLTTAGIVTTDANGNLGSATAASFGTSFIQNGTAPQTASFNVSGSGTIGGAATIGGTANIGGAATALTLQVVSSSPVSTQGGFLQWNRSNNDGETWLLNQKGISNNGLDGFRFGGVTTANAVTEYARFIGNGNFGLGTIAPTALLDVNGATRLRGLTTAGLVTTDASGNLSSATAASLDATTANNGLTKTGVNITLGGTLSAATSVAQAGFNLGFTGGNVGIGTTSPRTPLEVNGIALFGGGTLPNTINATGIGWNAVSPGIGETEFYNYRGLGTGGFRFFSIANTGTPSAANQVAYITPTGSYTALSDRRVKTNIVGLQQGLRTVLALRPVSYDFHTSRRIDHGVVTFLPDDKPVKALGFVAQELYQVLPEAVEKPQDERTGLYTVSYTTLVPVLTQAIQEQQAQIEALKAQNAALAAKAAALEGRAAQADADHASLLTLQAQMARLLGETAPANAQARK